MDEVILSEMKWYDVLLSGAQWYRSLRGGKWYHVVALPYGPGPFDCWTNFQPSCTHDLKEIETYTKDGAITQAVYNPPMRFNCYDDSKHRDPC